MKESGVGREYGPEGIAAFTEIQSIHRDKPA
jgi:acyl-CoA reductase-like NAD-dependent aldehyde dehydrogenase